MVIDDEMNNIFPALSYETDQEKLLRVSKMAEQQINMRFKCSNLVSSKLTPQYIINEQQHYDPTCGQATHIKDDMVINIQLLYDSHAPMEPDLWNGNFHLIFLHRSIKHIVLNVKNIKGISKAI